MPTPALLTILLSEMRSEQEYFCDPSKEYGQRREYQYAVRKEEERPTHQVDLWTVPYARSIPPCHTPDPLRRYQWTPPYLYVPQ
jgi:hypothetical protein